MSRTRSKEFREEEILSVVFDNELGLCGWLGDKRIDNAVYGFGPRQDFIRALENKIKFQIRNMGGLSEHPILRRVVRRFQQGLEKKCKDNDGFPVSMRKRGKIHMRRKLTKILVEKGFHRCEELEEFSQLVEKLNKEKNCIKENQRQHTKEAVVRQYFRDFLENLGDCEFDDDFDELNDEESNQIISDAFFSGGLMISWSVKQHTLMLKFVAEKMNARKVACMHACALETES
jgi:hypothetical protein